MVLVITSICISEVYIGCVFANGYFPFHLDFASETETVVVWWCDIFMILLKCKQKNTELFESYRLILRNGLTFGHLWCKGCMCALSVHITTNCICSRMEHQPECCLKGNPNINCLFFFCSCPYHHPFIWTTSL